MPWFADPDTRRHKSSSSHRSRRRRAAAASSSTDEDELNQSDISSGSDYDDAETGSRGGGRYSAVDTRRRPASGRNSHTPSVSPPSTGWFGLTSSHQNAKDQKTRRSKPTRTRQPKNRSVFASAVAGVGAVVAAIRASVERLTPKTSHGWGLMVLFTLFTLYVIDFYSLSNELSPHGPITSSHSAQTLSLGGAAGTKKEKLPFSEAEPKAPAAEPLSVNPPGDAEEKKNQPDSQPVSHISNPELDAKLAERKDAPPADPPAPPAAPAAEPAAAAAVAVPAAPPPAPVILTPAKEEIPKTEEKAMPDSDPASSAGDLESPFQRTRSDLTVPGGTGKLSQETIKEYYTKLSQAYLAPFAEGIRRKSFFNILMRRTYSLTPPGANKGIQSMLFQIKDQKLYLLDPYKVPENSKPFYKSRINEMIWILSKLVAAGRIPNTEFLVSIHDCVQTVSKTHPYRAAKFAESNPSFTIVSCNFSDNIPLPMWEGDELRGGGYSSWEGKMKEYSEDPYPWAEKTSKAVFRGGIRQSTYFGDKSEAEKQCDTGGRVKLAILGEENPNLFDVSVSGTCQGKHRSLKRLTPQEHHRYKYVFYAEGNCFWADRVNKQVFGPSVIMMQRTPCGQFFEPLLKPMVHFIDVDFFFTDAAEKIEWLQSHDEDAQQIVRNANEFAWNFLSLNGIETYIEAMMEEYTKLLVDKEITIENGAVDVTGKTL